MTRTARWTSLPEATPDTTQIVVFRVGQAQYGAPLEEVEEVVGMAALTPAPNTPDWVAGYLNLRGDIVPVADMRIRLHQQPHPPILPNTLIIILRAGDQRAGWIVDDASDVAHLPPAWAENGGKTMPILNGKPLHLLEAQEYIHELHDLTMHSVGVPGQGGKQK